MRSAPDLLNVLTVQSVPARKAAAFSNRGFVCTTGDATAGEINEQYQ
jgi:hypothetical protein